MAATRSAPAALHALVFAGGACALSWEILWQLQASLAFGVSALGTALTLAATMAGMTSGALLAGAWLRRRGSARPLRVYGALEAVIGVSGLLMLPGFAALERLDARVYALAPALAPALQALGIFALLAPATLAMGATVPVFQGLARDFGTRISTLYAANTAGAGVGVLGLSFAVLPALGVWGSCAAIAALNLAVFALSRWARAPAPGAAAEAPLDPNAAIPGIRYPVALGVVFCTGLVSFALEVAWFRALRAAFWSTTGSFAVMLAAVLLPLALGARLAPWLRARSLPPALPLVVAAVAIALATPVVERMDLLAEMEGPYALVIGRWLLLSLAVVGPAMAALATLLPWCLEEHRDPERTGRLYAANTLGAVVGSLGAAWILLPSLGFARSSWVLAGGLCCVGLALASPRQRPLAVAAALVAGFLAVSQTSSPGRDRPYRMRDSVDRVLAHAEGPDFTTSVIESPQGVRRLMIDGFSATREDPRSTHYMAWMGRLPALLHAEPRFGLVICFGTGQTANALRHEGLDRVDVVDVSSRVFALAPFFPSNEAVLEDPRVRAIAMDGRAWLRRSGASYDVITLEPMPPNFSGMNALYSREFYEIMASRLAPAGVVAQWLPIHLLTPEHAASVAASFRAVFPDSVLWFDPVSPTGILLGRRDAPGPPLGSEWPGLLREAPGRDLDPDEVQRSLWLGPEALAGFVAGARPVSDDNQLLQFSQLRAGLRGERGERLTRANMQRLRHLAGRRPYLRGARAPRPAPAGPKPDARRR